MFSVSLRASPEQIEAVMKFGKKNSGVYGYMRYQKATKPALAVIVPKKVDKRSSKRNQLKRRARTLMTRLSEQKPLPYTIVFYATQLATFAELEKELTQLWPQ